MNVNSQKSGSLPLPQREPPSLQPTPAASSTPGPPSTPQAKDETIKDGDKASIAVKRENSAKNTAGLHTPGAASSFNLRTSPTKGTIPQEKAKPSERKRLKKLEGKTPEQIKLFEETRRRNEEAGARHAEEKKKATAFAIAEKTIARIPNIDDAIVSRRRIVNYSLNSSHRADMNEDQRKSVGGSRGADKAFLFSRFGYETAQPGENEHTPRLQL